MKAPRIYRWRRVIWRGEAMPDGKYVYLGSEGCLIWGHFLTERLITDSGLITPKLHVCHCSLEELSF